MAETAEAAESRWYYILSLKWSRGETCVVWWKPDNKGYTRFLDGAGKYSAEQVAAEPRYYNNGDSTRAIPCDAVDAVARRAVFDRDAYRLAEESAKGGA